MRRGGLAVLSALLLMTTVALGACGSGDDGDRTTTSTTPTSRTTTSGTPTSRTTPTTARAAACDSSALSVDRRAGLLVFATTDGTEASVRQAVEEGVGGVFVPADNAWIAGGGLADLVRTAARRPLASIDEEGGRVQRLEDTLGPIPAARDLSARSPEEIRSVAAAHGRKMAALGFTMDFAPVLDVVDDDRVGETAIGDRSFSADPAIVTRTAGAFAEGLSSAGILPTYKHFPGHGRASGDSHELLPETPPLAALEQIDLKPYDALLAPGRPTAAVMVGHLDVPGLTDGEPASLSRAAVSDLLRGQMGFDGLIVTDDLGAMDAITDRYPVPEAAGRAIEAGVDMVLVPLADADAVVAEVIAAIDRGTLPESQLTASADRVLSAQHAGECGG